MKPTSRVRSGLHKGLLLAGPLALSVHCDAGGREAGVTELTINLELASTFVRELDACLVDQAACVALCERILVEQGYVDHPGAAEIYQCSVTKRDSLVEVRMSYGDYPVSVGCGVVMVQPRSTRTSIGSHYAALAQLEAASVYAFARLARDLRRHDAPVPLVRAAMKAAADEVRHTRLTTMLAYAWGARPRPPRRDLQPSRDLFTLGLDNAVDGCVHETFGAAIAAHQARTAQDSSIRSTMVSIARDEARHAALAEAIDRWVRPRLGQAQREAVETAARQASHELAVSQTSAPEDVSDLAGFPSAADAQALATALEAARRVRSS